jgi:aminopeptidase
MNIGAPENTADGIEVAAERRALLAQSRQPLLQRRLADEIPWVACRFPTAALAQESGMSLPEFEDFLYGACLLDWDAEGARMQRIKERFDRASEVRILGDRTDLRVSLEGREGEVDDGHYNMPGGEVFPCFPRPGRDRRRANGLPRRASRRGDGGEERSDAARDARPRRRRPRPRRARHRLQPGIHRHMKNTLFDEKIDGTVHLAIGAGIPSLGGRNQSSVHCDMVKDLRSGGRLLCDGDVVQENGRWLL